MESTRAGILSFSQDRKFNLTKQGNHWPSRVAGEELQGDDVCRVGGAGIDLTKESE
jgi:hypothetical protein